MKHQPYLDARFFFSTSPLPCPYLPERMERRVVTELIGRKAAQMHDQLSDGGFRRSHSIAYAPACPHCNACVAVRVRADDFQPTRSQRRVWNRNRHLVVEETEAIATTEQFNLFTEYQKHRHGDGDMSRMDIFDYQALIEDTPVDTTVVEFRDTTGRLVAACLTDRMQNGLSAVYSFFDPVLQRDSLGTFMILWLIEQARQSRLAYVYLGFWIAQSPKMAYKTQFRPLEIRTPEGWQPLGESDQKDHSRDKTRAGLAAE